MKEVIKTHNLCKAYGDYNALLNIDLTIKQGDIYE